MLQIFRNHNPYVVILLIVVTIVLKFYYLTHPLPVIVLEHQGIWDLLTNWLGWQNGSPLFFTFLALLNVLGQAIYLNKIVLSAQLYQYKTYLPAFSYVLLTSFMPEWNYLSVYMLSNWFVLGLFANVVKLGDTADARKLIFNSGIMVAMAAIMVASNAFLIFILIVGMVVLRSFRLSEWMLLLLGALTPFYFTLGTLFLLDQLPFFTQLFSLDLMVLPDLSAFSLQEILLPIIVIGFYLLLGMWSLNTMSSKMLVQVKKLWIIIIAAFFISTLAGFFNVSEGFYAWISALLPLSIIFATLWYASYRKWVLDILFYLGIAFSLFLQWM